MLDSLPATSTLLTGVMASISWPLCGRDTERKTLERLTRSRKSEFLAIYGRRRIGKTFLVRRFFQEQPVVYFE